MAALVMGGGALTLPQILPRSSWRERWARLTSWPESSSTFRSRESDSRRLLSSSILELRAESLAPAEEVRLVRASDFAIILSGNVVCGVGVCAWRKKRLIFKKYQ